MRGDKMGIIAVGLALMLGFFGGKNAGTSMIDVIENAKQKIGTVKDTIRGEKERAWMTWHNFTIDVKRPYGSGHIDSDDPEVIRQESRQEYGYQDTPAGGYGYVRTNPDK